jgi:hypothetical protein
MSETPLIEHVARQICRALATKLSFHSGKVIEAIASKGGQDLRSVLEFAVSQQWLTDHGETVELTQAGRKMAIRSRAGIAHKRRQVP